MQKLLIALMSEEMTDALEQVFGNEFELRTCHDGETALELLHDFKPDALVLDLILPFKDGLTLLAESDHKPGVILMLTHFFPDYAGRRVVELGVQYVLHTPTVSTVRQQLMSLLAEKRNDGEGRVAALLHSLGFRTNLDGYRQLCVGIPIFAGNPGMLLSKELYPAIGEAFCLPDCRTVEHSIRLAIEKAWVRRNPIVWEKYFPGAQAAPTNKVFISRMAEVAELS